MKQGSCSPCRKGVIDTGRQQIVYRETGPGEYEGVKVELSARMVDEIGRFTPS